MSRLMKHPKAWGGRDYGYKPDEKVYSAGERIELQKANCQHERRETISFDTVLLCLDCGREEAL